MTTQVRLALVFDIPEQAIEVDGERRHLRAIPAAILGTLLLRPGAALSRNELFASVWGRLYDGPTDADLLRVHVGYLRQRLGRFASCIETVHGYGYRLRMPAEAGYRDWSEA